MVKRVVVVAVILITIAATSGGLIWYWFTQTPGTVILYADVPWPGPGCPPGAWKGGRCVIGGLTTNSTILGIYITFVGVKAHVAGEGNQTGWHSVIDSTRTISVNPNGYESLIGNANLAQGRYDLLGFNVSKVVVDLQSVGNVTYIISGGGFVFPLSVHRQDASGRLYVVTNGFAISAESSAVADLYMQLPYGEIMAENETLNLSGSVDVYY